MINTCKKCGKQAEGEHYTFHHGHTITETDEKVGETKSAIVRREGRNVRQFYTNITQASCFLCGDCLNKWSRKKFWGAFIPALILTPMGVYVFLTLDEIRTILEQLAGMGLIVFAAVTLFMSVYYILPGNKNKGEELAVEIGKEEIKNSDSFWDSMEYKKLSSWSNTYGGSIQSLQEEQNISATTNQYPQAPDHELDKHKLKPYYDSLSANSINARCDAAHNLLREGGAEGVRWLVKALRSGDPNAYDAAIWAFASEFEFQRYRKEMDERELQIALREATSILADYINNIKLQPGILYLTVEDNQTLNALTVIGDASALPALNSLLEKLTKRRQHDGYQREYLRTGKVEGWIDNDGGVEHVKRVIDALSKTKLPREEISLGLSPVLSPAKDDRATKKPTVNEEQISNPPLAPVIEAGEKMETNESQLVSHDNQERNQSQSEPSVEPNPLGRLLTIVITIGVSILIGIIWGPGILPGGSSGSGDVIDFAGKAGNIVGMTCGMATLVGPVTYAVMRKLFPKRPASPNITKSKSDYEKTSGSSLAAKAPIGEAAPGMIAPRPREAARKPKTGVILLLALIVFGIASVIWMQTAANGIDLRSLFVSQSAQAPLGAGAGNPGEAPVDCQLWSEISAADAGHPVCAYGVVKAVYLGDGITYIRFSDEKDTFRFINLNGEDFSEVISQCVKAEGIVKTYGQMPYIEVGDRVKLCK